MANPTRYTKVGVSGKKSLASSPEAILPFLMNESDFYYKTIVLSTVKELSLLPARFETKIKVPVGIIVNAYLIVKVPETVSITPNIILELTLPIPGSQLIFDEQDVDVTGIFVGIKDVVVLQPNTLAFKIPSDFETLEAEVVLQMIGTDDIADLNP